jgi:hypothetical protein
LGSLSLSGNLGLLGNLSYWVIELLTRFKTYIKTKSPSAFRPTGSPYLLLLILTFEGILTERAPPRQRGIDRVKRCTM